MSRILAILSGLAILTALVAGALALLPGPLHASGVVDLETAFAMLATYAPVAAAGAGILGLIAGILALWRRRWVTLVSSVAALAVGGAVILSLLDFRETAAANPLHDVTTDLDDPPQFEALSPRQYEPDAPDVQAAHPHPTWRATHAEIYPDIDTETLAVPLDQALERATSAAEAMGWAIEAVDSNDDTVRIEAVATTGWFGFNDNVVVRLTRLSPDRVAVDARSVSRIGISDVGANAARLRAFFEQLEGAAGAS